MMREDESHLKWRQFLAGDNDAYCWLYKTYIQVLFRYAHRFTSNTELIKDCIQDIFTELYRNRDQLLSPQNVKVYLLIAMKNRLINALYRENRYIPYDSEVVAFTLDLTVEEQYVSDEQYTNQQKKIQRILTMLTPRQKEIIYYRYIEELSMEEICVIMNLNYQSAQNLIQRSLKKIRDLYGPVEVFFLLVSISLR